MTQRVNSVQTLATAPQAANTIVAADRVGLMSLSDDQWNMLVNFLNERKQTGPSSSLTGMSLENSSIVDSGATNHMTCSLGFLSNVQDISLVPGNFQMEDLVLPLRKEQWLLVLG